MVKAPRSKGESLYLHGLCSILKHVFGRNYPECARDMQVSGAYLQIRVSKSLIPYSSDS